MYKTFGANGIEENARRGLCELLLGRDGHKMMCFVSGVRIIKAPSRQLDFCSG